MNGPFSDRRPLRELHLKTLSNRVNDIGRATYAGSTVQPNRDFFMTVWVGSREEPEEQLTSLVGIARDRQKSSVRLAYREIDLRECGTIHHKLVGGIVVEVERPLIQAVVLKRLIGNSLLNDRLGSLGSPDSILTTDCRGEAREAKSGDKA